MKKKSPIKWLWSILLIIVLVLMTIRSIQFLGWLFNQYYNESLKRPVITNQYDWTLILTAIGWVIVFFWFIRSPKEQFTKSWPQKTILYWNPRLWFAHKLTKKSKDVESKPDGNGDETKVYR